MTRLTRIRDVLTTRGRAFGAAGLTLLFGGLLLGFADITRVGVLLTALPLLAALIARHTANGVEVTRTVHPARLVIDQSARVELLLQNTSKRRTRLQLAEERVHHLLGDRPRFVLPPMEPGEIREVGYQIRSRVRGRYRLGPLMLRVRDPYGLATVAASLPSSTDVLVLPRVEILSSTRPQGEGVGAEGSIPHMIAQHGEDDVAVRSYRNGDDLRRIHWPATAHRSQLMVRQEDHPARRRAVIVLDSRAAGHQGSETLGSFEWAVTAAASIAAHLSERLYALHLVSRETTADGVATQTIEINDALAALATARTGLAAELDEVLHSAHSLTAAGGLVIAIATDHDEAALERTAALRQPGGTGLMFLLDSAGFARARPGPPADRTMALADLVAAAGWSTCVVGAGMTVAQAWNIASARTAVRAGAGR
jgi:uncharacterized protein (DUF58 family)